MEDNLHPLLAQCKVSSIVLANLNQPMAYSASIVVNTHCVVCRVVGGCARRRGEAGVQPQQGGVGGDAR